MILKDSDFRDESVKLAAYLMSISARTAPKAKGEDDVKVVYADGEDKDNLANKMIEKGKRKIFKRDGENLKAASAVLLLGVNGGKTLGLDCGACGYDCNTFPQEEDRIEGEDYKGPNCAFKLLDLGIAIGSVVKMSSIFNVDNRVMYTVGAAARSMGLIDGDVVIGIPLSSMGKNIFFDRLEEQKRKEKEDKG
ncbi:MAG: ferredoxin domain-containing protein [Halobacteriota archaeon]